MLEPKIPKKVNHPGSLPSPSTDSSLSRPPQRTPETVLHKPSDKLGLEEIVRLTNKVGLEYVHAKQEAERLELMKPIVRAQIALRLDQGNVSEARLKRLTDADPEYIDFIEKFSTAKAESERLRIRYESYKNLFDARRSLLSYQKAEMKLL